jgi:hypothetical protein
MKAMFFAAAFLVLIFSCNLLPKKSAKIPKPAPAVIGSWNLITLKGIDMAGRIHYPYEKNVQGFATFDTLNNFTMQFYASSRPLMANRDPYYCSDSDIRIAFLSCNSSYGKYRLSADSLFLQLTASLNPTLSWSSERLSYKIHGDTLLLVTPGRIRNGFMLSEHTVWLRAE